MDQTIGPLIFIDDPEDPRIGLYRAVRERDLVGREGVFVAEGAVVLRLLLASVRHRPGSLLIDERRRDALASLLDQVPSDVPVYVASQAVLDAIAGFHLHRGILAIGESLPSPDVVGLISAAPEEAVFAVLCGIGNHDNMGGVFRNAAAFGAQAVLLDAHCCDPLYRKAIRVSVGAALTVPFARWSGETAGLVQALEAGGFEVMALSPTGVEGLVQVRRRKRTALLLGAEGPGLDPAILSRARTVRVEMAGRFDSLNVAVTSGIVLHHLLHGAGTSG